jgi:hypothetical protein
LLEEWDSSLRSTGYKAIQISWSTGGGVEFLFTIWKFCFDSMNGLCLSLPTLVFLTYKYSHKMELQHEVSQLDVNHYLFLWLLTTKGIDGAAGMGIAESLTLEFNTWDIHVAIFDSMLYS